MNIANNKLIQKIGAGSVLAAVVVALLIPLNMGGCSGSDVASSIGGAVGGTLTGNGGGGGNAVVNGGGGGGLPIPNLGSGSNGIDYGQLSQGVFEIARGLSLGENEERALGQEVALSATSRWNVVNDDALNKYVQMVAQTLADATPEGGQPVAMVLDTNYPNAFSAPTGYIMVTRGLLANLRDESELAGVIGHEMGHVIKSHGLNSAKQAMVTSGLIKAGTASVSQRQLADMGSPLANQIISSGFNKAQEREADEIAVQLSYAAGYDPQGYVRALQHLQPLQQGGGNAFSTHPDIASRIQSVSNQIASQKLSGGQTNQPRYEANVLTRH